MDEVVLGFTDELDDHDEAEKPRLGSKDAEPVALTLVTKVDNEDAEDGKEAVVVAYTAVPVVVEVIINEEVLIAKEVVKLEVLGGVSVELRSVGVRSARLELVVYR